MEERKLEWESEEAKKERAIREANREMDARAGLFNRNWEENPDVHHSSAAESAPPEPEKQESSQPAAPVPKATAAAPYPKNQTPRRKASVLDEHRQRRAARQRANRIRRQQRPRRRKHGSRSHLHQQISAMRRIRIYLLITAAVLLLAGIGLAILIPDDSPQTAACLSACTPLFCRIR